MRCQIKPCDINQIAIGTKKTENILRGAEQEARAREQGNTALQHNRRELRHQAAKQKRWG